MSVQPTNSLYKRVPLPIIQPATETMIPGANFLPPRSSEPVPISSLSPEQQRNLTTAIGEYLRANYQGYKEPECIPEVLSDACKGWLIARGPLPQIDPEVWGAIANALDAQAPEWNPKPSTVDPELDILSKPAAGSNIGTTLYDEYIMNRTQGL